MASSGMESFQYGEVRIQLLDSPAEPGILITPSSTAPAYIFKLPSAAGPGLISNCKLSYSMDETAFSGVFGFEVPGLTIQQVAEIKASGFVQFIAGYENLPGREPRTMFYGTVDHIEPRFEYGKLRWSFTCKAAISELFSIRFPISGQTIASDGRSAIRFTVEDGFKAVEAALGIRVIYPLYASGIATTIPSAPGFVPKQEDEDFLDLVSIPDYSENTTALVHIRNFVAILQSAILKRFGITRRIAYAAEAQEMETPTTRLFVADLDTSENFVFLDIDMDSPFVMGGGPTTSTEQESFENAEGDVQTETASSTGFTLVTPFNPDMIPSTIVRARSEQLAALWVWPPTEIQHEFPVTGGWRTQAKGSIQRTEDEVVV